MGGISAIWRNFEENLSIVDPGLDLIWSSRTAPEYRTSERLYTNDYGK